MTFAFGARRTPISLSISIQVSLLAGTRTVPPDAQAKGAKRIMVPRNRSLKTQSNSSTSIGHPHGRRIEVRAKEVPFSWPLSSPERRAGIEAMLRLACRVGIITRRVWSLEMPDRGRGRASVPFYPTSVHLAVLVLSSFCSSHTPTSS